jgi:hypothetical protein
MTKNRNQLEFDRDFRQVSVIGGKIVGQLVNYPQVTAKGANLQELQNNLAIQLSDYLKTNEGIDFELGK